MGSRHAITPPGPEPRSPNPAREPKEVLSLPRFGSGQVPGTQHLGTLSGRWVEPPSSPQMCG